MLFFGHAPRSSRTVRITRCALALLAVFAIGTPAIAGTGTLVLIGYVQARHALSIVPTKVTAAAARTPASAVTSNGYEFVIEELRNHDAPYTIEVLVTPQKTRADWTSLISDFEVTYNTESVDSNGRHFSKTIVPQNASAAPIATHHVSITPKNTNAALETSATIVFSIAAN